MSPRVLVLDNYDSFTFNLVQAFQVLGARVVVHRNDALTVQQALALDATHLVVSPGPGHPAAAGISVPLIQAALGRLPLLGVCLGHQALAYAMGTKVGAARTLHHGEASRVQHDGRGLFEGLPGVVDFGRYHSLAVDPSTLPTELEVSARAPDGEVMAIRHRQLQAAGVQFHPESVLSPRGPELLATFLSQRGGLRQPARRIA